MYSPPLQDMRFVLNHVVGLDSHAEAIGKGDLLGGQLVDAILDEAGKLAKDIIAPINHDGDIIGSVRNDDGSVTTPPGFAEAYRALADGGWTAVEAEERFGGQGLPMCLSALINEMWDSANMSWGLCHLLTQGQVYALSKAASAEQQMRFIPPMVEGRWTGTMNLTEPQAGTDLAGIKTKAVQENGHYRITGQKIYITYGEHDMAENIIHLVLARLPDAPEGVGGISVFIVPKYLVNDDGTLGARNDVHCLSIEKKLGIKASPTAVLGFGENDGAIGYLVGKEHNGLAVMFEMMNHARFSVGIQGLGISERAYQAAAGYALERKQGIPLGGKAGDTIIHHPDVLRLLATMKAEIAAMRAMAAYCGAMMDLAHGDEKHEARVALLVPIVKGWLTERAQEITSKAVQVHGGMGYIEETGVAQHYRDARILPIYEGTTAIQANDMVFRKTLRDDGGEVAGMMEEMEADVGLAKDSGDEIVMRAASAMEDAISDARGAVDHLLANSGDARLAATSGVNYLMLMGTLTGGWMMLRSGIAAAELGDDEFAADKLASVDVFMTHTLPETAALARRVMRGDSAVLAMRPEWFM